VFAYEKKKTKVARTEVDKILKGRSDGREKNGKRAKLMVFHGEELLQDNTTCQA
jgi:hypothetical protein